MARDLIAGFRTRLVECNTARHDRFVPLFVDGVRLGHVREDRVTTCLDVLPCRLDASGSPRIDLAVESTPAARTAAFAAAASALATAGATRSESGERYSVHPGRFGDPAWFLVERAAMSWFGFRSYGVHLNGFVRTPNGLEMWIAERARGKSTFPGMLDNMVAGGQPSGLTLLDNVVKECGEEAAIPPDLAREAVASGLVSYVVEHASGLKPDVMFCFDLELPDDFVPRNTDGEVAAFHRMAIEDVARRVAETRDFKFNCNLVVIDFLVRRGFVPADTPGFEALVRGLRS